MLQWQFSRRNSRIVAYTTKYVLSTLLQKQFANPRFSIEKMQSSDYSYEGNTTQIKNKNYKAVSE